MITKYLYVNWITYQEFAQKLASAIISDTRKFDEIVAISRGGLSFGQLLSDMLRLPISTFTIQSYQDIYSQNSVKITQKLAKSLKGKKILLVDDAADTGKTFKKAVSYLNKFNPKSIHTASIFYKPWSVFKPDYYARQIKEWFIFPYENTEMIILITKNLTREGKTKLQIQKELLKIGFKLDQIAFTRKHYLK